MTLMLKPGLPLTSAHADVEISGFGVGELVRQVGDLQGSITL